MKRICTKYRETGICEIDIDLVIKKWNHLWLISQWNDTYRLIKYVRYDSQNTALKISISGIQAMELIDKLGLTWKYGYFKSAKTWRRKSDETILKLKTNLNNSEK